MTDDQPDDTQDLLESDRKDSPQAGPSIGSQIVVGGNVQTGGGDVIVGDKIVYPEDFAYTVVGLTNPYLGLSAFTYAERTLYAGRGDALAHTVHKLTDAGAERVLLFVTGASGSGKSSFVLAGLLPALERRYAELRRPVRWAVVRPSKNPMAGLAQALAALGLPAEGVFADAAPFFSASTLQPAAAGQISLLVVDQFEELFTQSVPDQREAFLALLAALPSFADMPMHIVATVRADYLPDLFKYKTLYDLAKSGEDLRVMTPDELAQAIRQPLEATYPSSGKHFEDGLLAKLVEDAAGDAAYLPLLQVTLAELWNGGKLKLSQYKGLDTAIQQRADRALTTTYVDGRAVDRSENEQREMMALLLDLVVVTPDGDPQRAMRKRRRVDALLVGRSAERRRLIDELSNRRLLVTRNEWDLDIQRDVQVVDLIHEALIANWPRLRDEIAIQRSVLQQRLRFELAVNDWKGAEKSDKYLLQGIYLEDGKRLSQAGDVALQSGDATNLLGRSVDAENRRLRRQRRVAVAISAVLIVLMVAALGAAAIALNRQQNAEAAQATAQAQATRADNAAAIAEAETRRARSGELAAQATTEIDEDPDLSILLALQAISTSHTAQAEDALRGALQADNLQASLPHSATVSGISFSPDGARLITGDDRVLRVWDTVSHQLLETWSGHNAFTTRIAYQPQGTQVATANLNRNGDGRVIDVAIRLWDPNTAEILQTLTGHTDAIFGLDYSADGTRLASASFDGTARVWDVRSGESFSLPVASRVWDVALSPDGRILATAGADGAARLWDLASQLLITTPYQSKSPLYTVAFSPDGNLWATAGGDQVIRLWRRGHEDRPVATLVGHTDSIMDLAFSADGKRLVSAGAEGAALIWDVSSLDAGARLVEKLSGHQGSLWVAQYNPSTTLVATGGSDKTARIWSVAAHNAPINALAFGPASSGLLATAGLDNTARIWRFAEGNMSLVHTLPHDGIVRKAVFSPDGQTVATVSGDRSGRLWDLRTGQLLRSLTGHTAEVKSVAFSPDGSLVATASDDQTTRIWDAASGELRLTLKGDNNGVNDVVFSPDGAYVATVGNAAPDGGLAQVRLWNLADGSFEVLAEDAKDLERLAFSPEGTRLAFAGASGIVTLWNVATRRSVHLPIAHTDRVYGLAFDETGRRLATTGNDGRVLVWNIATGELPKELPYGDFEITGVDFSPDGKYLVTAGRNGRVYVQALAVEDLKQQALRRLTRWWRPAECEQLLRAGCPAKPIVGSP